MQLRNNKSSYALTTCHLSNSEHISSATTAEPSLTTSPCVTTTPDLVFITNMVAQNPAVITHGAKNSNGKETNKQETAMKKIKFFFLFTMKRISIDVLWPTKGSKEYN